MLNPKSIPTSFTGRMNAVSVGEHRLHVAFVQHELYILCISRGGGGIFSHSLANPFEEKRAGIVAKREALSTYRLSSANTARCPDPMSPLVYDEWHCQLGSYRM